MPTKAEKAATKVQIKIERNIRKRKKREAIRTFIFNRDNGQCYWCCRKLVLILEGTDVTNIPKAIRLTLDHVRPKSKNGNNKIWNLVACCPKCNGNRGNALVNPNTGEFISPIGIHWLLKYKEVENVVS